MDMEGSVSRRRGTLRAWSDTEDSEGQWEAAPELPSGILGADGVAEEAAALGLGKPHRWKRREAKQALRGEASMHEPDEELVFLSNGLVNPMEQERLRSRGQEDHRRRRGMRIESEGATKAQVQARSGALVPAEVATVEHDRDRHRRRKLQAEAVTSAEVASVDETATEMFAVEAAILKEAELAIAPLVQPRKERDRRRRRQAELDETAQGRLPSDRRRRHSTLEAQAAGVAIPGEERDGLQLQVPKPVAPFALPKSAPTSVRAALAAQEAAAAQEGVAQSLVERKRKQRGDTEQEFLATAPPATPPPPVAIVADGKEKRRKALPRPPPPLPVPTASQEEMLGPPPRGGKPRKEARGKVPKEKKEAKEVLGEDVRHLRPEKPHNSKKDKDQQKQMENERERERERDKAREKEKEKKRRKKEKKEKKRNKGESPIQTEMLPPGPHMFPAGMMVPQSMFNPMAARMMMMGRPGPMGYIMPRHMMMVRPGMGYPVGAMGMQGFPGVGSGPHGSPPTGGSASSGGLGASQRAQSTKRRGRKEQQVQPGAGSSPPSAASSSSPSSRRGKPTPTPPIAPPSPVEGPADVLLAQPSAPLQPPPGVESPDEDNAAEPRECTAITAPAAARQDHPPSPAADQLPEESLRPVLCRVSTGWTEVQAGRSIEDLQRELDVERHRQQHTVATQTEGDLDDEVPEECAERWFAGFKHHAPIAGNSPTEAPRRGKQKSGTSASSGAGSGDEAGACRPERQMRRRPSGSRSRSSARAIVEGPATADGQMPVAQTSSRSSSSSSSTSSDSSENRRQRATSSEDEATKGAKAALAVAFPAGADGTPVLTVEPRARVVDYSDVL